MYVHIEHYRSGMVAYMASYGPHAGLSDRTTWMDVHADYVENVPKPDAADTLDYWMGAK